MTSKIVKLLAEIMEGLQKELTIEELNNNLSQNKEIDSKTLGIAYSLIYDHLVPNKKNHNKGRNTPKRFRFLSKEEIDVLGIENYNYLLKYFNVGLINQDTFDNIIDQLMIFPDTKISKEDIDWMILISLIEVNEEIVPGSRVLLFSTDVIN